MRKKYLSALLFGALLFASAGTFTSCKDYDDDISNLQEQINTISTTLKDLEAQVGQTGVSSVTFDEATGVLTVVDAEGTHTYTVKTPAGEVAEVDVVIDDERNLVVNDKVIGQVGDVVAVDEDGELTVNGEKTGITVGKYAILENIADNMYTITLPDANGELQTIQLPKASSTITVTLNDATNNFTLREVDAPAGLTFTKDGINWGEAVADVDDWAGPKGPVKKGQLLVGQINEIGVTVRPVAYDLSAQELAFVDSEGNEAKVNVIAVPAGNTDPINTGSRASDSKGEWYLTVEMTDEVTVDNMGKAFANADNDANLKYALSVNGAIVTDYEYVIDTDKNKVSTNPAYTGNWDGIFVVGAQRGTNKNEFTMPLGSSMVTVTDPDAYDIHVSISKQDENDAEAWGVSIDENNVITATDAAANHKIHFDISVMGVDGRIYEYTSSLAVTFGETTVDAEEIAPTTFEVPAGDMEDLVINLGTTFTSLTADEAIALKSGKCSWSLNSATTFLVNTLNVKYYSDAECRNEIGFDDSQDNIRKIQYAKIDMSSLNAAAKPGDYKLTLTLSASTGEIKKIDAPVIVTLPTFDELFEKSAAWNEAGDVVTLRLTHDGKAQMMTAYKTSLITANPSTKADLVVKFDKVKSDAGSDVSAVGGDKATIDKNGDQFIITSDVINNSAHTLKTVTAQSTYNVQGITGFEVKSDKYTINFVTPLDGAELVYYVDGVVTPLSINGIRGTFDAYNVDTEGLKQGIALNVNTVDYKLSTETINTLLLSATNWKSSFDASAGNDATATVANGNLTISDLSALTYETQMTLTYEGAVTVDTATANASVEASVSVNN